jgi:hypothetical protein
VTARVAALVLFAALCGVASATMPPTTLALAPGRIAGLAQDGPRVMWGYVLSKSKTCLDAVRVHNFSNGTEADLTHANRGSCQIVEPYGYGNELFALAGRSGLWTVHELGNNAYVDIVTGTLGGTDRELGQLISDSSDGVGSHFTGAAGDGPTLVYSWVDLGAHTDCVIHPNCRLYVDGGGVRRVLNGSQAKIPNVPPATAVAAFGTSIALAVAPLHAAWGQPGRMRRVELRRVPGGALLGFFNVHGRVRALSMTGRAIAVLLASGATERIEIYSRATRRLVRSVKVAGKTTSALSFSGRTVVFHAKRTIYALDTSSGRVRAIARAGRPPLGVTIEGSRVVWAENYPFGDRDARGRVKTLTLP